MNKKNHPPVIDELCSCGLLKSHHMNEVVEIDGQSCVVEEGHGAAPGCERFTWVDFISSQADPRYIAALQKWENLSVKRFRYAIERRWRPYTYSPMQAKPFYEYIDVGNSNLEQAEAVLTDVEKWGAGCNAPPACTIVKVALPYNIKSSYYGERAPTLLS